MKDSQLDEIYELNMILFALQIALEIAARAVESEGYKPHIISDSIIGEAR